MPKTCVYVIAIRGRNDVCKVGFTGNINKRLRAINSGMPDVAYCYHKVEFASRIRAANAETDAHRALAEFKRKGEWFFVDPSKGKEAVIATSAEALPRFLSGPRLRRLVFADAQ